MTKIAKIQEIKNWQESIKKHEIQIAQKPDKIQKSKKIQSTVFEYPHLNFNAKNNVQIFEFSRKKW